MKLRMLLMTERNRTSGLEQSLGHSDIAHVHYIYIYNPLKSERSYIYSYRYIYIYINTDFLCVYIYIYIYRKSVFRFFRSRVLDTLK